MGTVWLAEDEALKRPVAMKIIASELGALPKARARFLREAQLAARISSAHVVQIYDHGVSDSGQPYIAMEYLVGESLRDRLDRGPLTVGEAARMVSHVCRGLARAHEAGLIHRDLKPDNVFVAREGDEEVVKVLDFGVAKAQDALGDSDVDPTRTGALVGTPYYMSPEQAQGLKTIDHRTDLWSMGVLVYECLTGQRPFTAQALGPLIGKILVAPVVPPSAAAPAARLPPQLDAWMARALTRDPEARFTSAKELAEAFLIATGSAASMDRDASTLPPFGSQPAMLDTAAYGALPVAAEVADSKRGALEQTVALAPQAAPLPPISAAAVRTHDDASTVRMTPDALPEGDRPHGTSSSRLPWILVGILATVVIVLAGLLVMRR
jgi:serine/threonine-protein kinase